MSTDREVGDRVQVAAWRLERAMSRLEARLERRLARLEASFAEADDRAQLAAELAASQARARDLESAGAAAASALGRAIVQIRGVLAEQTAKA
jgi:hypothetical protein